MKRGIFVGKRLKLGLMSLLLVLCLVLPQAAFAQDAAPSQGQNADLDYLKSVIDMIKEKYKGDVTDKQLIEGALKGMFGTMDPYTTYFTSDEAKSFLDEMDGSYVGIGVMISKIGDYCVIGKVFPGSPAEKAGIFIEDKIVEVNGKSVVGASTDETSKLIKGEPGTKAALGIARGGSTNIIKIEVAREKITINPVTYEIKGDIGYIKLDIFNSNTFGFMLRALREIDQAGVKKVILDLRDNPGGEVDMAVLVAQKFVPQGLITKLDFKSEDIKDQEYYSELKEPKYKLAVLVNKMSASASEILSGAIQDTKAGTLIGTKTFGKAKVQSVIPILTPEAYKKYEAQTGKKLTDAEDLSKYGVSPQENEIIGWSKITTGLYTTPNGRMIDGAGLTPDITVEDPVPVAGIDINNIQKLVKASKPALNSESPDVYNAEKILKAAGYDVDAPDIKLDEKTYRAIAKFQKDSGLYPYGVLDFTTQQALNDKLEKLLLANDKQYAKAIEILSK